MKTASITVSSGTSAISVVNVRLLAVRPRRSSRKRARSVRRVSNQGQLRSVCTGPASSAHASVGRVWETVMATIMPNMADHSAAALDRARPRHRCDTRGAVAVGLLALIVLGLAWELWLAPAPARGTLVLKALPLRLAAARPAAHRMYTYRWLSLAVWLYVAEGLVRVADATPAIAVVLAAPRCCWRIVAVRGLRDAGALAPDAPRNRRRCAALARALVTPLRAARIGARATC